MQLIIDDVRVGNLTKVEAGEFAYNLHDYVGGAFKIERMEANFQYGRRAVEKILGSWFEKAAYRLNKEEAISHLKSPLAKAEKNALVHEIEKVSALGE